MRRGRHRRRGDDVAAVQSPSASRSDTTLPVRPRTPPPPLGSREPRPVADDTSSPIDEDEEDDFVPSWSKNYGHDDLRRCGGASSPDGSDLMAHAGAKQSPRTRTRSGSISNSPRTSRQATTTRSHHRTHFGTGAPSLTSLVWALRSVLDINGPEPLLTTNAHIPGIIHTASVRVRAPEDATMPPPPPPERV